MARVVYVAGYGRSGSTVLDIVLGSHPEVVGLGEVSLLVEDWSNPKRTCACGASYRDCSFWKDLPVDPSDPETAAAVRDVERVENFRRLRRGRVLPETARRYRAYHEALFAHVTARSGARYILDSSKSARHIAGRYLALARLAGQDVRVIHLVRSGATTLESVLFNGSNWEIEGHGGKRRFPALRGISGWISSNLVASAAPRLLGRDRYLLLRYEDFVGDAPLALRRIGRFLDLDVEDLVRRVQDNEALPVAHLVGGNRVRLQGSVQLKAAPAKASRLSLRHRVLFAVTAGWLQRRFDRPVTHGAETETR